MQLLATHGGGRWGMRRPRAMAAGSRGLPAASLALIAAALWLPAQESRPGEAPAYTLTALLEGDSFVRIPAGEFTMGADEGPAQEQPAHRVRITRDFEMGRYEVSQAQWEAVMRNPHARPGTDGGREVNPSHFRGPSRPVENVSWEAVQQFLRNLNARDERYRYRLPTEAEWEYAARAGGEGEPYGDLAASAWCEATSGGETHPVGQKALNAWGLYDMLGNVAEWVADWHSLDYYSASPGVDLDPIGPATGSYKVYRGGAWLSSAGYCRAGARGFDFPVNGQDSVGFRLVREPR
jgi:formylglycine-generating enzyme required for sulfatase activity